MSRRHNRSSSSSSSSSVSSAVCEPPVHHEQVGVPNHAYTLHKQQHTDNWLEHRVRNNRAPVTQEIHYMEHPSTTSCSACRPPRRPTGGCCNPPVHSEMVNIPHHIYTKHTQPTTRRWMTHKVNANRQPVTQETLFKSHPTLDACPPGQGF